MMRMHRLHQRLMSDTQKSDLKSVRIDEYHTLLRTSNHQLMMQIYFVKQRINKEGGLHCSMICFQIIWEEKKEKTQKSELPLTVSAEKIIRVMNNGNRAKEGKRSFNYMKCLYLTWKLGRKPTIGVIEVFSCTIQKKINKGWIITIFLVAQQNSSLSPSSSPLPLSPTGGSTHSWHSSEFSSEDRQQQM